MNSGNGWGRIVWAAISQLMLAVASGAVWVAEFAEKKTKPVSDQ